jgi:glyoxylase-like metal-dependent hydrolase (beta-lactamase superfamily II)
VAWGKADDDYKRAVWAELAQRRHCAFRRGRMTLLPDSIQVFERGWLSSNNIMLLGRHDTAIIDTGYVSHAPQTLALVRHALHGRHLDQIINTHLHSDHCGGNAILQAHFGCKTSIPVAEADKVRHWDVEALSFKATGQRCDRFTFDATVAPGDVLKLADMEWQALAAPGHDPHSADLLLSARKCWSRPMRCGKTALA